MTRTPLTRKTLLTTVLVEQRLSRAPTESLVMRKVWEAMMVEVVLLEGPTD